MRNVFDQYSQPENRLTHALATCLHEDKKLLSDFVYWVTGEKIKGALSIVEQTLPGQRELLGNETDQTGLPDMWIFNDEGWCLLVENKVADSIRKEQLVRHYKTAERRGFTNIKVLAMDVLPPSHRLPHYVEFRLWSALYQWLHTKKSRSDWVGRMLDYMAVAESKLVFDEYLRDGTLTTFSGITFSADNPYSYLEAKRLIKLAFVELKKSRRLKTELKIDPQLPGRGAITGKEAPGVWDCLRLAVSKAESSFTSYPHFTLSIRRDDVFALVTVPNSITPVFRKNLLSLGEQGFAKVFERVARNYMKVLRVEKNAIPWVEVLQRHYKSQRSIPVVDARLAFDLRTAFKGLQKNSAVKYQPHWMSASFAALDEKRANTQLAVGVLFPYATCNTVSSDTILKLVEETWISSKPLIEALI